MKKKILIGLFVAIVVVSIYGVYKPLPEGLALYGDVYTVPSTSVTFLKDSTYTDESGIRYSDQEIFDVVYEMIDGAEHYILVDMFFFSDFLGTATSSYRELSSELTTALIEKKQRDPEITIQVITDPINTVYGGYDPEHFIALRENGIAVIITDLTALRDSNPLYSGAWRTLFSWLPERGAGDILPNLFDVRKPDVNIVSYLNSFNFKANHRKVVLADYREGNRSGISTLITSANPHDGSSAHTNTALKVDDFLWKDVLQSERTVALFSGASFMEPDQVFLQAVVDREGTGVSGAQVQLLTERAIETRIIELLDELGEGDEFLMAMFYISDRDIVKALKRADDRGVEIRLLLDANKDAFGREKNGVPNRQVARELLEHSGGNTTVRWCDTHGEQCHSKMLIFKRGDSYGVLQGSANLTRRNLHNLNLETGVYITGAPAVQAIRDAVEFFETQWSNEEGKFYSLPYEEYEDDSFVKKILYRVGEFTGMSSY